MVQKDIRSERLMLCTVIMLLLSEARVVPLEDSTCSLNSFHNLFLTFLRMKKNDSQLQIEWKDRKWPQRDKTMTRRRLCFVPWCSAFYRAVCADQQMQHSLEVFKPERVIQPGSLLLKWKRCRSPVSAFSIHLPPLSLSPPPSLIVHRVHFS